MSAQLEDWEVLSADWRAQRIVTHPLSDGAADRLRQRVRRATRRQWLQLSLECLLSFGSAGVAWAALSRPDGRGMTFALAVAALNLIVWAFALWNRRGSWLPFGENTQEYVRVSRARAVAARRDIAFVRIVLLISVVAFIPAFTAQFQGGVLGRGEWWRWAFFATYVVSFLGWTVWERRRVAGEEASLAEVQRQLEES